MSNAQTIHTLEIHCPKCGTYKDTRTQLTSKQVKCRRCYERYGRATMLEPWQWTWLASAIVKAVKV